MLDLATISTVLNQTYAPHISDQLNQRTDLLAMVPRAIGETGKNIAWDVKVSRSPVGGSYASGADITLAGTEFDTEKPAVLQWKRFQTPFQVSGDALAVAARSGPDAYSKLFDKQLKDAARNLSIILGTQIYGDGTGNSGLDMDGILAAIGATTGSYAGLSRVTYPIWQAYVSGNSGTPRNLTETLLLNAETSIFATSGFTPDVIVTTPALYQKYETLFNAGAPNGSLLRHMSEDGAYRMGATSLTWKGIPIIRDARCPAGSLFMLTLDAFTVEMLPSIPVADGVEIEEGQEVLTNANGDLGIQVGIELLGKTGDAVKGFVKGYMNLKCEHPNRNAYLYDLQ